jgi:hypothetical protein
MIVVFTGRSLEEDSSAALYSYYIYKNLVEILGIEPSMPEGGGFTVHCITIDASSPLYFPYRNTR